MIALFASSRTMARTTPGTLDPTWVLKAPAEPSVVPSVLNFFRLPEKLPPAMIEPSAVTTILFT